MKLMPKHPSKHPKTSQHIPESLILVTLIFGVTRDHYGDVKIDFSGTNRIWMGVRGTDRGGSPIAKSVEFSKVPGREGHHLLGQSLRKNFHFLLLFLDFCLYAYAGLEPATSRAR